LHNWVWPTVSGQLPWREVMNVLEAARKRH
jgi:hypothetical protein